MKSQGRVIITSVILIIILGFAVYGNSLNGKFVFDDNVLIKQNFYIRDWSRIEEFLRGNISTHSSAKEFNFYRPIQMITYVADYSLWRLDVKGYHLTNILLHIGVGLLIYWLVNILYGDMLLSFLASMFFVIHPIHSEAISYVSGRSDSLAALFMLLCFIFYIKTYHSNKTKFWRFFALIIFTVLSYTVSLLSREASLILPVLLLLYHITFKKRLKIMTFLYILVVSFVYILLRLTVLRDILAHSSVPTTFFQRLPGFFIAIVNYIRLLIFPFHLHMAYGIKLFKFADSRVIVGFLIPIFLLLYAFRKREKDKLIFFSISWFFIALLPVSNLVPINAYMAEHWLYLPSIGVFIILARGLALLFRKRKFRYVTVISIVTLLIFYSYLTIKQNEYWKEPVTFYEKTLRYAPDNWKLYTNLGIVYNEIGNHEEAIALHKKAIEINPAYVNTYNNLGMVYNETGDNKEAISAYKKAIEIAPDNAEVYYNLGKAYYDIGKKEEAISAYKKALEIFPDYADALNNLGNAYCAIGKNEEAMIVFKKAIEIDPRYPEPRNNLGIAYSAVGKSGDAIPSYKKAIELRPDYAEAYSNLGSAYFSIGRNGDAISSYKKALEIDPEYVEVYYNLGRAYSAIGRKEQAISSYKKSLEIDPDRVEAWYNLGVVNSAIGKYNEAISAFKKALELSPNYKEAYNNLGIAYSAVGKNREAMLFFKKALEIDSHYENAYNNLEILYKNLGIDKE